MAGQWPFRRSRVAGVEAPPRASTPGALKRDRRALVRERERLVRDLGGLVYEMFRLDRFRVDVVADRCGELVAVDERLGEIDRLLSGAGRRGRRCECGSPLPWGSHFCPNCGRPAGPTPVVACARCGTPLAADVRFCGNCGSAVELGPELPADTEPDADPAEPLPAAGAREP